ncbi:fibronectin type III domain-containing protein [bacterium]|nr:fibronectin type III domain-containing protein [bacterium]
MRLPCLVILISIVATAGFAHTLSGIVYGGPSPMENATVSLLDPSTMDTLDSTTTNASGFYALSVGDGTYNLRVSPPTGSGYFESDVNDIVVDGADVTQNVVLLAEAGVLCGTVFAADGVTSVSAIEVAASGGGLSSQVKTVSDANGYYELHVPPGVYSLHISGSQNSDPPPNIETCDSFTIFDIIYHINVSGNVNQDIVLLPFIKISGHVYGNGEPMAGASIYKLGMAEDGIALAYADDWVDTDENGAYEVRTFPGEERFDITPPEGSGYEPKTFGYWTYTEDSIQDFHFERPLTLSGHVYAADGITPAAYIEVSANGTGGVNVREYADAEGYYELEVPSGTYTLSLTGSTHSSPPIGIESPDLFGISGVVSNLAVFEDTIQDMTLPPFYRVTGQVRGNGVPLEGVELWFIGDDYMHDYVTGTDNLRTSDSNGEFEFLTFWGVFTADVTPPPDSGFLDQRFRRIDVTGDMTYNIDLERPVSLSGTVRAHDGTTLVSGIEVYAGGDTSVTGASGQYELEVLPGEYWLAVQGGEFISRPLNIDCPKLFALLDAVPKITVNLETVQDVILPEFIHVTGNTTDNNGVPVPGTDLELVLSGDPCEDWSTSDGNGAYSMTVLPGEYRQEIDPPLNSGFYSIRMYNVDIPGPLQQNIVLSHEDTHAPLVIAGPYVNSITGTTATVEWQTNEPASTKALFGTSSPPSLVAEVPGIRSQHSVLLSGLAPGETYFVRASATDSSSNGPTLSPVTSFRTQSVSDTQPPVILGGPVVVSIEHDSAIVEWTTNEPADSSVAFSAMRSSETLVTDSALVRDHRIALSGLAAETSYSAFVSSTDGSGNGPVVSPSITFRTLHAPDTTPPVITSGPMAIDVTDSEATIVWTTNEPATSGVSYNDGTVFGVHSDTALVTAHSVQLVDLDAATIYYFTVSTKDASGNGPTLSETLDFTTSASPDTEAPVTIEGPLVKNVTHQSAVIWWRTNEPATSVVEYGTSTTLGLQEAQATLNRIHNIPVVGLEADTLYYFRVASVDGSGNESSASSILSFHTDALPDTTAPVFLTEPYVIDVTNESAVLYWETDEPADSVVEYGASLPYASRSSNSDKVREHWMTLVGLSESEEYGFRVSSMDISGNVAIYESPVPGGSRAAGFVTSSTPDVVAPTLINGPSVVAKTDTSATIWWKTSELADTRLWHGTQGADPALFEGDIAHRIEHTVTLTNLEPATDYCFRAGSADVSGNGPTMSSIINFSTDADPDTIPPAIIDGPIADGITLSAATISWETDEFAGSRVLFGTDEADLKREANKDGMRNSHSVTLTGLEPGTEYFYSVVSEDLSGNSAPSPTKSFRTTLIPRPDIWILR